MPNDFYNATGNPPDNTNVVSPDMRAEFSAIAAGFAKLPTLTGNAYKIAYINAAGAAMDVVGGNGLLKLSTTGVPSIATPGIDYVTLAGAEALTNKTFNGNTWTAGTGTLTIAAGKTLTASKTLTLTGTDGTTMTFPATSASIARTDAAQTLTGLQTLAGGHSDTGVVVSGYGIGAGGTVTQLTSKSTAVTLDKPTGRITMHNQALAAGDRIGFQCNNSLITINDTVVINAIANGNYEVQATVANGSFSVYVKNITAGSLSEALALSFVIIKGATS